MTDGYLNSHELYIAYCNFVHEKAGAHDFKVCSQYDIDPSDPHADQQVEELVRQDWEEGLADHLYEQGRAA